MVDGTNKLDVAVRAPQQAAKAGLNALAFDEDFISLSFYHPTKNPNGTWRFNDFWQGPNEAGYIDFGGQRTFMINQCMTGAGSTPSSNQDALNAIAPYFPASQLDDTTMRLACTRARLDRRPELRRVVNSDSVTWVGAFLTTERSHPFSQADITRPAYIEARIRFSPANIPGIFSSFWLYDTSEAPGSPEIDIFESNDHDPKFWKTNIHHSGSGPSFNMTHRQNWCDGNFHTFGLLWQPSSLKVFYDDVLSQEITGPNADFFSMPMRLMITHTCDARWCGSMAVPSNVETVYMDIDYIRVWKEGPAPDLKPKPEPEPEPVQESRYECVVDSITISPENATIGQEIKISQVIRLVLRP